MFRLSIPVSDEPLAPNKVEEKVDGPWTVETWEITGVEGDRVPVNVNRSASVEPRLALLGGHGLYGSKTAPYLKGAARRWTKDGVETFIPDLPFHGDRSVDGADPTMAMTPTAVMQAMGDLSRCLDFIRSRPTTSQLPTAFLGFSMSTLLGVPFVAADDRIGAAAFVVGGSHLATTLEADPHMPDSIREQLTSMDPTTYASGTRGRPILMLNGDQDEQFSRKSAFDLFDAFGSPKEIGFFEGTHVVWPRPKPIYDRMLEFVLRLTL